jgi:hypothetical protein
MKGGDQPKAVLALLDALHNLLASTTNISVVMGDLGHSYKKHTGRVLLADVRVAGFNGTVAELLQLSPSRFAVTGECGPAQRVRAKRCLCAPVAALNIKKLGGFDFFHSIGSPRFVVAPMVEQSEYAYRMLTRRYGATLCYTPMVHSRLFVEDKRYRERIYADLAGWPTTDRPLFVQFCGNDPQMLLRAGKLVEGRCDAFDLNFGCPQGIAR